MDKVEWEQEWAKVGKLLDTGDIDKALAATTTE